MAADNITWTIENCLNEAARLPYDKYVMEKDEQTVAVTSWAVVDDIKDRAGTVSVIQAPLSQPFSCPEKAESCLATLKSNHASAYIVQTARFFHQSRPSDAERLKAFIGKIH